MKLYLLLCLVTVSVHIRKPVRQLDGKISIESYSCTGVFVGPETVLTAGHCLEEAINKPWVNIPGSSLPYSASIITADHFHDLGLIHIDKIPPQQFAPLAKSVSITQHIYSVHNGNDHMRTYGEGIIENITPFDDTTAPMLMHSMAIKHGDSGSGIFNSEGELVGINTLTEDTFSWAVSLTDIRKFLKAYKGIS